MKLGWGESKLVSASENCEKKLKIFQKSIKILFLFNVFL